MVVFRGKSVFFYIFFILLAKTPLFILMRFQYFLSNLTYHSIITYRFQIENRVYRYIAVEFNSLFYI